jgi:hypothetical protein
MIQVERLAADRLQVILNVAKVVGDAEIGEFSAQGRGWIGAGTPPLLTHSAILEGRCFYEQSGLTLIITRVA